MYFSDLQNKLVLEKASGEIMGYIGDAEIDISLGKIESYYVDKTTGIFKKELSAKRVGVSEIYSIGEEMIFLKSHEH